ncbi:MAG: hypothetical protein KDC90_13240, partial [Ignavibacteriae bacterium]|nr:hypothetical protein [Ignavibacteriota bacterium]
MKIQFKEIEKILSKIIAVVFVLGVMIYISNGVVNKSKVTDIVLSNRNESVVTIIWETDKASIAKVKLYSPNSLSGTEVYYDDRDGVDKKNRFLHHVTISDLEPSTKYEFAMMDSFIKVDSPIKNFETYPIIEDIIEPKAVYGSVLLDNNKEYSDGIVIAQVVSSQGASEFVSTYINNNSYSLDLGFVREHNVNNSFQNSTNDSEQIYYLIEDESEVYKAAQVGYSGNDQPLPIYYIAGDDKIKFYNQENQVMSKVKLIQEVKAIDCSICQNPHGSGSWDFGVEPTGPTDPSETAKHWCACYQDCSDELKSTTGQEFTEKDELFESACQPNNREGGIDYKEKRFKLFGSTDWAPGTAPGQSGYVGGSGGSAGGSGTSNTANINEQEERAALEKERNHRLSECRKEQNTEQCKKAVNDWYIKEIGKLPNKLAGAAEEKMQDYLEKLNVGDICEVNGFNGGNGNIMLSFVDNKCSSVCLLPNGTTGNVIGTTGDDVCCNANEDIYVQTNESITAKAQKCQDLDDEPYRSIRGCINQYDEGIREYYDCMAIALRVSTEGSDCSGKEFNLEDLDLKYVYEGRDKWFKLNHLISITAVETPEDNLIIGSKCVSNSEVNDFFCINDRVSSKCATVNEKVNFQTFRQGDFKVFTCASDKVFSSNNWQDNNNEAPSQLILTCNNGNITARMQETSTNDSSTNTSPSTAEVVTNSEITLTPSPSLAPESESGTTATDVGVNNNTTLTVCSQGCEYFSIQTAINNANDGDVIDIKNGDYTQAGGITINKAITLQGEDKDNVLIKSISISEASDVRVSQIKVVGNGNGYGIN